MTVHGRLRPVQTGQSDVHQQAGEKVTTNAVHPGAVDSDIYRELLKAVYLMLRLTLISPDCTGRYIAAMALLPEWKGCTDEFKSAHGPCQCRA